MCLLTTETVDGQRRSLCFDGVAFGFKVLLKRHICCQHILVIFQSICNSVFVVFVSLALLEWIKLHVSAVQPN